MWSPDFSGDKKNNQPTQPQRLYLLGAYIYEVCSDLEALLAICIDPYFPWELKQPSHSLICIEINQKWD